jgi:hypothetical protein
MPDEIPHYEVELIKPASPQPNRLFHISIEGRLAVSGPSDLVPRQIRPGKSCALTRCPNNEAGACTADPDGPPGNLAPFRPHCPEVPEPGEGQP